MAIKDDAIKIRVSKEQKKLIKEIADKEGSNMSDFVLKHIMPIVEHKELGFSHKEIIEERIKNTEGNIEKLRENLKTRKENNKNIKKNNWLIRFFNRL